MHVGSLAASCNSLLVSGRPGLILATVNKNIIHSIASESEVRWIEECTSSFHLNPSSCRISCFLYVRAFLASINLYVVHLSSAYTGGTGSLSSLSTDFQWWWCTLALQASIISARTRKWVSEWLFTRSVTPANDCQKLRSSWRIAHSCW